MIIQYKPINFVVLRMSGIPLEFLNHFNLSDDLINEINNNRFFDKKISEKINKNFDLIIQEFPKILKDYRFRDLIRISTLNYDTLIKKSLTSKAILSQYHRKILMYLQRGCSKCCTAGSFGPVSIGEFESSSKNIDIFKENEERFIMIEDWALLSILNSQNIQIKQEEHHRIMEDYTLLKKFKNKKINSFVELIDKYKITFDPEKRDSLYKEILILFRDFFAEFKKESPDKRKKDYESRSIFYELKKRDFTFQIGENLKKDLEKLDKIFGIYLILLTKKYLEEIKKNKFKDEKEIAEYVFSNFEKFSNIIVEGIISKRITDYSQIEYLFEVMPPIFSPDITISARNLKNLCDGDYNLIIGETHVSATVISNPMYEFKREKLISLFVSSLKGITNNQIDFQGYLIKKDMDFTHNLPISVQTEIIKESNKTSGDKKKIYAYRSDKFLANKKSLFNLLFFPLAVGRRLIFNYHKDEEWGMWSRDYFPKIIKKITEKLYPELNEKISFRECKNILPPKMPYFKKITPQYLFSMIKCINKWKQENNLGDELFVRYDVNRKPIYVNLKNPYLVYELIKLSSFAKTISVSEFNPTKDFQWLKDKEGEYCSEIRYMICPNINSQKVFNKKNKQSIIYLPGYQSRFDELTLLKRGLSKSSINVESLNLDYNQEFDVIAKKTAEYIKKNYKKSVFLIGLSFGGVLSIKIAEILGKKIKGVFSLNSFFKRRGILKQNKYERNFEDISVANFFPKNTPIFLFSGKKDDRISPKNSEEIARLGKNTKLFKISDGDHVFSNTHSQKTLVKIILDKIKDLDKS